MESFLKASNEPPERQREVAHLYYTDDLIYVSVYEKERAPTPCTAPHAAPASR